MIRASASGTELLSRCQFWASEGVEWRDDANEFTALGNIVDEYLTLLTTNPKARPPACEDPTTASMLVQVERWWRANGLVGMRSQVAFAYDVVADTGREIVSQVGFRDYSSKGEYEICGTSDLVYMGQDDAGAFVAIDDLKCEFGPSKDHTAQLKTLALAATKAYGADRARTRTIRVRADGVDDSDVIWFDDFDLSGHAFDLAAWTKAASGAPEPTPCTHCTERYCPALAACPATQGAVDEVETLSQALLPASALVRRDAPLTCAIETPDQAAGVLERVRIIKKMCEMLEGSVKEFVGDAGVTLSDGSTLQPTFRVVTRVSSKDLEQLARDKGATDDEINRCATSRKENAGLRVVTLKSEKKRKTA